ncbi:MAG: acetylneuraminic acid synthetase [Crocinitomicaceae bacterium]|nr:acetylneuraminic acid synthetase [Crocinitomicaceae bacterium]|tara:strand:- start:25972 stop:27030 length:1059 start_codon:yes stop_codon:yes gene_type:complete
MKLAEIIKKGRSKFPSFSPYMLAEAGVNHEGSMELAERLINEAAEGGAHGIKFQTYKAGYIASKDSPSYWDLKKEPTTSQFELFKKYDSFWKDEYEKLKVLCDKAGIEFFSTPFDVHSADFLNELMDVFKVSSSDLNNLPFIEKLCDYGKPILLSTGSSFNWEVERTVELVQSKGNAISIMHCVLNYPTPNENANLAMILDHINKFPELTVGYSDHTLPEDMEVSMIATCLGAEIIEKHFTHDKSLPGNDHYHAMDKEDLIHYFERLKRTKTLLGNPNKQPLPSEAKSRNNARRSLVAARNIANGKTIVAEDLTWKRPAHGINPADISLVVGKEALIDIEEDTVLKYSMFDI